MYGEAELLCIKTDSKKFISKFELSLGFLLMLYIMYLREA